MGLRPEPFFLLLVEVFERLLRERPKAMDQVKPLEGDVGSDSLGLSPADQRTVLDNVSVVFHLAASLNFKSPLKEAVEDNTAGTQRVLDFCCQISKLEVAARSSSSRPRPALRPPHGPRPLIPRRSVAVLRVRVHGLLPLRAGGAGGARVPAESRPAPGHADVQRFGPRDPPRCVQTVGTLRHPVASASRAGAQRSNGREGPPRPAVAVPGSWASTPTRTRSPSSWRRPWSTSTTRECPCPLRALRSVSAGAEKQSTPFQEPARPPLLPVPVPPLLAV